MSSPMTDINLLTYNGEDPTFTEESVCQNCLIKESEKPPLLHRCPRCLVVSYCSVECLAADARNHEESCRNTVNQRNGLQSAARELREEHNIMDIYQPFGPGRRIRRKIERYEQFRQGPGDEVTQVLWDYSAHAIGYHYSGGIHQLAWHANSKLLLETALDFTIQALRMDCESPYDTGNLVIRATKTLIRLNRLDDAVCFVRDYMAFIQAKVTNRPFTSRAWYLCRGEEGACYGDCLGWIRSTYRHTYVTKNYYETLSGEDHLTLVGIILTIKLWIRVAAARQAWEQTLRNVLFQTDMGEDLEAVYPVLRDMFMLEDDHEQLKQIRGLMSIIHALNPTRLNQMMRDDEEGISRIPGAHDLLSAEFQSENFLDMWTNEPLIASFEADRWKRLCQIIILVPMKIVKVYGCYFWFWYVYGYLGLKFWSFWGIFHAIIWGLNTLGRTLDLCAIIYTEWNQGKPDNNCLWYYYS